MTRRTSAGYFSSGASYTGRQCERRFQSADLAVSIRSAREGYDVESAIAGPDVPRLKPDVTDHEWPQVHMMAERTDLQYLYLTTTGRRTGLPREIEIWFTERDGRFYLIAEHGEHANWVRNIRANPQVHMRVGALQLNGTARLVDDEREPELALAVKSLSDAKYGWSNGLVAEISPND